MYIHQTFCKLLLSNNAPQSKIFSFMLASLVDLILVLDVKVHIPATLMWESFCLDTKEMQTWTIEQVRVYYLYQDFIYRMYYRINGIITDVNVDDFAEASKRIYNPPRHPNIAKLALGLDYSVFSAFSIIQRPVHRIMVRHPENAIIYVPPNLLLGRTYPAGMIGASYATAAEQKVLIFLSALYTRAMENSIRIDDLFFWTHPGNAREQIRDFHDLVRVYRKVMYLNFQSFSE